jgi:hypothetical protein
MSELQFEERNDGSNPSPPIIGGGSGTPRPPTTNPPPSTGDRGDQRTEDPPQNSILTLQLNSNIPDALVYINGTISSHRIPSTLQYSSEFFGERQKFRLAKNNTFYEEVYEIWLGGATRVDGVWFHSWVIRKITEERTVEIILEGPSPVYTLDFLGIRTDFDNPPRPQCIEYSVFPLTTNTNVLPFVDIQYITCDGEPATLQVPPTGTIINAREGTIEVVGPGRITVTPRDSILEGAEPLIHPDDDPSGPPPTIELLHPVKFHIDGDDESVNITTGTRQRKLTNGSLFTSRIGDRFTLESVNSITSTRARYTVDEIRIESSVKEPVVFNANPNESLSVEFNVPGALNVFIKTTLVQRLARPVLRMRDMDLSYNVNSTEPYSFRVWTDGATEYELSIDNKTIANPTVDGWTTISIPPSIFDKIGNYKVFIVARGQNGDSDPLEFVIQVFDGVYVETPTITSIEYPTQIIGPDFVGRNVDFTVKWEGVGITETHIYFGTSQNHIIVDGDSVTLNVDDIYSKFNQGDIVPKRLKSEDGFEFILKLVPHSHEGKEDIVGEGVLIPITFFEGINKIRRDVLRNNIVDATQTTFNRSIFDTDISKILTHLFHLDNGYSIPIVNWGSDDNGLILKLYEPLPEEFGQNTTGWVSKIQSNPIIETVTLLGRLDSSITQLRGPNLSLKPSTNLGYMEYDKLISGQTSEDVVKEFLTNKGIDVENLNILYGTYSPTGTIAEVAYSNFVHFGSAAELIHNFVYKLRQLEVYNLNLEKLVESGNSLVNINLQKVNNSINDVNRSFTGFEKFLYKDSDLWDGGNLINTTSNEFKDWYEDILSVAEKYDFNNVNYIVNNMPIHIRKNTDNGDFILFLDMIGNYFDIIWAYITTLKRLKSVSHNKYESVPDKLVYHLLESFGWDAARPFDTALLWKYFFGTNEDGSPKTAIPLEDATNQVWRRILNNLPYLLKHKGTERSLRAIMSCYGIPSSLLTIMEFGGPAGYDEDSTQRVTFDDRTASIVLTQSAQISVPWKGVSGSYPQSIEFRIKPQNTGMVSLVKNSTNFEVSLEPTVRNLGRLIISYGGTTYQTGEFPAYGGEYTHLFLQVREVTGQSYLELYAFLNDGESVIAKVVWATEISGLSSWESGTSLIFGEGFVGNYDEIRLWKAPFSSQKTLLNHALFPDAIDGNTITSSTDDLYFRLDFEWPKNRAIDPNIKNVAISDEYAEPFATAIGFDNINAYPYNYQPYERTVTANVPKTGFSFSNKVRLEDITLVSDLSYKSRASVKSFDRATIDSNRLGIFFSPVRELNMDILKTFGDFSIDDYIGNPADFEEFEYGELRDLRNYYFKRIQLKMYDYIKLIKYIDKSLFQTIEQLVPARAYLTTGLLIEPHLLQRSKVKWTRPTALSKYFETLIDASETVVTQMFFKNIMGNVLVNDTLAVRGAISDNLGLVDANTVKVFSITDRLEGSTRYDGPLLLVKLSHYEGATRHEWRTAFLIEIENQSLQNIGGNLESLTESGYGIYFDNQSIAKVQLYNDSGALLHIPSTTRQLTSSDYRKKVWIKNENISRKTDRTSTQTITENRRTVVFTNTDQSLGSPYVLAHTLYPSGYLPTHHRFTNSRTTGMENGFFNGSKQTIETTVDGLPPVQTFDTNPNVLRVANTGRGSGEPVLVVE